VLLFGLEFPLHQAAARGYSSLSVIRCPGTFTPIFVNPRKSRCAKSGPVATFHRDAYASYAYQNSAEFTNQKMTCLTIKLLRVIA
jgi:hypothetical protein